MLEPYVSVAVSAQSKSADACGEFVKMLMSDDVQQAFAKSDNLILNREAFRAAAKETVDYFNAEGGDYFLGYAKAGGNPNQNRIKFSEKNVDEFEKIILSISRMNSADASINLILVEEMPAYFSGQKELADVIKIAQDRAQKVISERG
jgi:ABC-type sugar transport system substrate-binding protein